MRRMSDRMLVALAAAALLLACGAAPPPVVTPAGDALTVQGTVELPEDAQGWVVITWLPTGAVEDSSRMMENLIVGVGRALVLPATSGATASFELPIRDSSPDVQVLAWLVGEGQGLEGVFGPPTVSGPVDARDAASVQLVLSMPESHERAEPCTGERRELFSLDAPRGSAGGGPQTRLCAFLPVDYEADSDRRYPVLVALPGLGSGHVNGIARATRELLDRLAPEIGDAIVVGVDIRTPFGSSYLVDSPLTGPWATFITEQVVEEIDRRFRTRPSREARAVIGHSTGGFDAVSIALRRPDAFGVVAASSPDALDLEAWMLDDSRQRARPLWHGWVRVEDQLGGPGQLTSYAAEWSPSPDGARGFVWPIDVQTGAVIDTVWRRWLAQSPITWLDDERGLGRARRYDDRFFLTCGRPDEPLLFVPTERFHQALERVGIEHAWEPTELRHTEGGSERFEPLVRYVMDRVGEDAASAP